jgi:hypothetical protein
MNDRLPGCRVSATQLWAGKDQRRSGYKSDVTLSPRLTEGLFGLNYFQIVELDTVSIIDFLLLMSHSLLVNLRLLPREFTLS